MKFKSPYTFLNPRESYQVQTYNYFTSFSSVQFTALSASSWAVLRAWLPAAPVHKPQYAQQITCFSHNVQTEITLIGIWPVASSPVPLLQQKRSSGAVRWLKSRRVSVTQGVTFWQHTRQWRANSLIFLWVSNEEKDKHKERARQLSRRVPCAPAANSGRSRKGTNTRCAKLLLLVPSVFQNLHPRISWTRGSTPLNKI